MWEALCLSTSFSAGDSGGGARQLIGNVWEWTACNVRFWNQRGEIELTQPLKSLRGGAFDTYFETQATCQLASGDSPIARKHNIGFRCAIGMHDLIPNISDLLDDASSTGEVSTMTRLTTQPLATYDLAPYAVSVSCFICDGGNKFDAEQCRFCQAHWH